MLRIQSLYLLLSTLVNFAIAVFSHFKDQELLNLSGLSPFSINLVWLIANTGAALNILEIFLYKNRNYQYQTVRFNNAIYFIFMLYIIFIAIFNKSSILLIPILGILFSLMFSIIATKNIKKDIDLLNSSNRLR
tara:strand:- start:17253 stop:17654 length:402 start_codon:yes stop_codon:yes gene_type:complete